MTRGTTPSYIITIKDLDDLAGNHVEVDIKQGAALLQFEDDDVIIDENTIKITLTQEQTLTLSAGSAKLQVRGIRQEGTVWASSIITVPVNPILRAGLISYD
jgi:hypothetical protein